MPLPLRCDRGYRGRFLRLSVRTPGILSSNTLSKRPTCFCCPEELTAERRTISCGSINIVAHIATQLSEWEKLERRSWQRHMNGWMLGQCPVTGTDRSVLPLGYNRGIFLYLELAQKGWRIRDLLGVEVRWMGKRKLRLSAT